MISSPSHACESLRDPCRARPCAWRRCDRRVDDERVPSPAGCASSRKDRTGTASPDATAENSADRGAESSRSTRNERSAPGSRRSMKRSCGAAHLRRRDGSRPRNRCGAGFGSVTRSSIARPLRAKISAGSRRSTLERTDDPLGQETRDDDQPTRASRTRDRKRLWPVLSAAMPIAMVHEEEEPSFSG